LISSQSDNTPLPETEGMPLVATPRLLATGEQIKVVTDMVVAEIDTVGGDLRRLELLQHPSSESKDIPYALLQSQASHISVAQSGLIGDGLPNHKTEYKLDSGTRDYTLAADQDKVVVRLVAPEVNGVQVTKIYTFHRGSYVIDVQFEVQNLGE